MRHTAGNAPGVHGSGAAGGPGHTTVLAGRDAQEQQQGQAGVQGFPPLPCISPRSAVLAWHGAMQMHPVRPSYPDSAPAPSYIHHTSPPPPPSRPVLRGALEEGTPYDTPIFTHRPRHSRLVFSGSRTSRHSPHSKTAGGRSGGNEGAGVAARTAGGGLEGVGLASLDRARRAGATLLRRPGFDKGYRASCRHPSPGAGKKAAGPAGRSGLLTGRPTCLRPGKAQQLLLQRAAPLDGILQMPAQHGRHGQRCVHVGEGGWVGGRWAARGWGVLRGGVVWCGVVWGWGGGRAPASFAWLAPWEAGGQPWSTACCPLQRPWCWHGQTACACQRGRVADRRQRQPGSAIARTFLREPSPNSTLNPASWAACAAGWARAVACAGRPAMGLPSHTGWQTGTAQACGGGARQAPAAGTLREPRCPPAWAAAPPTCTRAGLLSNAM